MRLVLVIFIVFSIGCDGPVSSTAARPVADESPASSSGDSALPAELGTRKAGVDWPGFLGPTGDSISTEKGIITPWPAEGLRIVWQRKLGTGYAMPAISRGRLFVFDRIRDRVPQRNRRRTVEIRLRDELRRPL
jgi:hypothetical protein